MIEYNLALADPRSGITATATINAEQDGTLLTRKEYTLTLRTDHALPAPETIVYSISAVGLVLVQSSHVSPIPNNKDHVVRFYVVGAGQYKLYIALYAMCYPFPLGIKPAKDGIKVGEIRFDLEAMKA